MKVGICIPCYYGHVGYLDCVLASITRQTIVPDIVSISISEYPEEQPSPIYNSELFKIVITTTSEQKNAAENRNIAANKIIEEVDILSFFDADDYCAPKRIEVIKDIFENHDTDLFLHSYFEWTQELQKKHVKDILPFLNKTPIEVTSRFKININPHLHFGQIIPCFTYDNYSITYGNVSIKTSSFSKIQFPEDELLFSCGEDSHFNYLHYKSGAKVLASSEQLTLYSIDPTNKLNSEVEKAMFNYLNNRSLSNNITS
jgi:hypothetical protein